MRRSRGENSLKEDFHACIWKEFGPREKQEKKNKKESEKKLRQPRSTRKESSAASEEYKRQVDMKALKENKQWQGGIESRKQRQQHCEIPEHAYQKQKQQDK